MITAFYTCKRPIPYIGQTLDNYFDLYDEQPVVFEQPGTEPYLNRTRVIRQATTANCLISNWMWMVEWLVNHTADSHYMLCEDDIVLRERIFVPAQQAEMYSPYCALVNKNGNGWHTPKVNTNGFCGALCVLLPRSSLEKLVTDKVSFLQLTQGLHLDNALGKFFPDLLVHYPTQVLHIGDISTREINNVESHLKDHNDICRTAAI